MFVHHARFTSISALTSEAANIIHHRVFYRGGRCASSMRLSSSIRRSLVPEMPISTYSPATVQPRRSAYSRSSRVSIVGVLPVVGGAHLRVDCDSHLSLQVACCIAGLCSGPGPSGAPFCHSSYRAPVIPRTACHSNSTIPGSELSDRRFRFLSERNLFLSFCSCPFAFCLWFT